MNPQEDWDVCTGMIGKSMQSVACWVVNAFSTTPGYSLRITELETAMPSMALHLPEFTKVQDEIADLEATTTNVAEFVRVVTSLQTVIPQMRPGYCKSITEDLKRKTMIVLQPLEKVNNISGFEFPNELKMLSALANKWMKLEPSECAFSQAAVEANRLISAHDAADLKDSLVSLSVSHMHAPFDRAIRAELEKKVEVTNGVDLTSNAESMQDLIKPYLKLVVTPPSDDDNGSVTKSIDLIGGGASSAGLATLSRTCTYQKKKYQLAEVSKTWNSLGDSMEARLTAETSRDAFQKLRKAVQTLAVADSLLGTPDNDIDEDLFDPTVLAAGQALSSEIRDAMLEGMRNKASEFYNTAKDKIMVGTDGRVWHAGTKTFDSVIKQASKLLCIPANNNMKPLIREFKKVYTMYQNH